LLFIVDDGGGVGGVDISMICWGVDIEVVEGNDGGNGGETEGDGGSGSINVRNAWLTRYDEHEYEWSSSIDSDDDLYFPPAFNDNDGLELFT
jgi:hypothetical protein